MTSEEVKELLRQLSKDTEEVGDIRSRTVRIRLSPQEEEEPAKEGEESAPEETAEQENEAPSDEEPEPDRQPRRRGRGLRSLLARKARKAPDGEAPDSAASDSEASGSEAGGRGASGRGTSGRGASGRGASGSEAGGRGASATGTPGSKTPGGEASEKSRIVKDSSTQKENGEADMPGSAGTVPGAGGEMRSLGKAPADTGVSEEDEMITRYMDDEEKKAYLEEKAGSSENPRKRRKQRRKIGEGGPKAAGPDAVPAQRKSRWAAFVERQRNTPVEPDEFERDAWMFRSDDDSGKEGSGAGPDGENSIPIKERSRKLLGFLKGKGLGLKELAIIGSIIVLVLLITAVVLTILGNRRKSLRVQADEGLRITVEKEPSKWCKGGPVELAVSTDSPIQSISVNSQPLNFTGQGRVKVSFEAAESTVQVTVVSEDATRSAQVGFARIDTGDPSVAVTSEEGKIRLTGEDDASGVDEIWYGTVDALSDVPSYELFKEPFEPEKGKLYTYFARDKAGNTSAPVTTNLSPAESISLNREEISLFAGESYELELTTKPSRAFLNGLEWTSSNDAVASVSGDGMVSALTDGVAIIEAKADGGLTASCTVQVRSEVSVTISAVGDMTLGEDASFSTLNNFTAVYTMYGPGYFLENVRSIFEADDITFANFEGTLTDQGSRQAKEYAFRGDPSYTQVLQSGSVEAVTLANNHSYDYGDVSHTDTQKYLEEAGVDWCEGDKIIVRDVSGVRMALIGIYVLADGAARAEQVESTIAQAKEQGAQLIVVAFHWGNERETKPDETQKMLAHLAIDSGADLVVGHHPHVLQGIEKYSGKYICYSLANFCFGGNSNPSDKDTMIFQQTFRILRGGKVEDGGVSVIPCSVSSVADWNNYQPTPATGAEADRIMEKINELCEPFGTAF